MNKKQILRTVAFLLIVALCLGVLCDLFEYPKSRASETMESFHDTGKNTVDVAYIGTSGVHRFWIPGKAFEEYGITVYPLAMDALPSWLVKNMVQEAFHRQNPKLVIIDVRSFAWNPASSIDTAEKRARRIIENIDFLSPNWFSSINRTLSLIHSLDEEKDRFDISYYLSFVRYHDMWSSDDFSFAELKEEPSKYMGYSVSVKTDDIKKIEPPYQTDEVGEMNETCEKDLNELCQWLKAEGINALFIASPRNLDEEKVKEFNRIFEIIDDYGFDSINCLDEEVYKAWNVNFSKDFYDTGHVNFKGAENYTAQLAKYLTENYDLKDHRNDPLCENWYGTYDAAKEYANMK